MQPATSLSVILPTSGQRRSLARALASLHGQDLRDGDEVLLMVDDHTQDMPRALWEQARLPGRLLLVPGGPHGDWGCAARNQALAVAAGAILCFLDDDDEFLPGALATVRTVVGASRRPTVFRIRRQNGQVSWQVPEVVIGEVTTQQYAVPNVAGRVGRWTPRYFGDFDFLAETARLWDGGIDWREELIAQMGYDEEDPRRFSREPGLAIAGTVGDDGIPAAASVAERQPD